MLTQFQKLAFELHLARLARRHRVPRSDPRIAVARRDALLYVGEGMAAGEAVRAAEVHAFRLYGLPR